MNYPHFLFKIHNQRPSPEQHLLSAQVGPSLRDRPSVRDGPEEADKHMKSEGKSSPRRGGIEHFFNTQRSLGWQVTRNVFCQRRRSFQDKHTGDEVVMLCKCSLRCAVFVRPFYRRWNISTSSGYTSRDGNPSADLLTCIDIGGFKDLKISNLSPRHRGMQNSTARELAE